MARRKPMRGTMGVPTMWPTHRRSCRNEVSAGPSYREAASGRRRALSLALVTLSLLMARPVRAADEAKPEEIPAAAQTAKFSPAQIEQLVAPIALYPDGLAGQVLLAATYPPEIVEAGRLLGNNA